MAINIQQENLLSLTEAAKVLPKVNGRKPAVSTLWRWCRKGLRGVRLDYLRIGRNIVTSPQALHRFFAELVEVDKKLESKSSAKIKRLKKRGISSKARLRSLEQADAILERAGI